MLLLPRSLILALSASLALAAEPKQDSTSGSALYPPGLQPLISRGNVLLSAGHFADAARAYTDAIELSPLDYTLYYKRGTAYFSLSRHSQSLADFERVTEMSSASGGGGLDKALLMQARIHARLGTWPDARAALKAYSSRPSGSKDKDETHSLLASLTAAESSASRASQSRRAGLNQACVDATTDALRVASHSPDLRALRAECALAAGDAPAAIGDFVRLTHLVQSPSEVMLTRLAALSYFLLPPSTQALTTLKQCLHSDPDSRLCKGMHKTVKKLDKVFTKLTSARDKGDWRSVVSTILGTTSTESLGSGLLKQFNDALWAAFPTDNADNSLPPSLSPPRSHSPQYKHLLHQLCVAHNQLSLTSKGEHWCNDLLSTYRSSSAGVADGEVSPLMLTVEEEKDALVGLGEAKLAKEEWDDAVRAFERAFEISGRADHDVASRLQKAQRLLKQSRSKDYYKVLDVARDADERTIKKAYRRAAKTAHPDKGGSEDKMAAVNEAYEVLSKPELRARFDNGDDPNDPTAQSGGHPFFQGGSPFGAGGSGHPFMQFFDQASRGQRSGGNGGFQFHFGGPR